MAFLHRLAPWPASTKTAMVPGRIAKPTKFRLETHDRQRGRRVLSDFILLGIVVPRTHLHRIAGIDLQRPVRQRHDVEQETETERPIRMAGQPGPKIITPKDAILFDLAVRGVPALLD